MRGDCTGYQQDDQEKNERSGEIREFPFVFREPQEEQKQYRCKLKDRPEDDKEAERQELPSQEKIERRPEH